MARAAGAGPNARRRRAGLGERYWPLSGFGGKASLRRPRRLLRRFPRPNAARAAGEAFAPRRLTPPLPPPGIPSGPALTEESGSMTLLTPPPSRSRRHVPRTPTRPDVTPRREEESARAGARNPRWAHVPSPFGLRLPRGRARRCVSGRGWSGEARRAAAFPAVPSAPAQGRRVDLGGIRCF